MKLVMKRIIIIAILAVAATASPKFGERIKKEDKQNGTDVLQVFRPKGETQARNELVANNQLSASDSKQKLLIDKKTENETQKVTNNNLNKEFTKERHFEYEFSAFHKTNDNNSNDNSTNQSDSTQPVLQHRSGPVNEEVEPNPQPKTETDDHHFTFPSAPDFHEFQFIFPDIQELAESEHISGPPVPSPPPQVAAHHSPLSDFQPFLPHHKNHEQIYEQSPNEQTFYQAKPVTATHNLDPGFSFGIPQRFPHPSNDPRVDFKKEQMGSQNTRGSPFGTKMSYTYRDPKNPQNFMEMSEVMMTVNREMDPQEAQSQIQNFIAAAQSGQYGPLQDVSRHDVQHADERHPNHNYNSDDSHFAPEPYEPNEPKFPNFR